MDETQVVELMKSSETEKEWEENCETVYKACGGGYPSFWYKAVILSGVCRQTSAKWGGTDQVSITKIKPLIIGAETAAEKGAAHPD